MKLASGVAPIAAYRDRGINVALGNDVPPCNNTLDPFTEMRQTSFLGKVDALDPTVLPAATVYEMATDKRTTAAGFDDVGKLREGWTADVIGIETTDVTRATPLNGVLSHLVDSAHGDDVPFTMVDGDVLMDDGDVMIADADAIRTAARRIELSVGDDSIVPYVSSNVSYVGDTASCQDRSAERSARTPSGFLRFMPPGSSAPPIHRDTPVPSDHHEAPSPCERLK